MDLRSTVEATLLHGTLWMGRKNLVSNHRAAGESFGKEAEESRAGEWTEIEPLKP